MSFDSDAVTLGGVARRRGERVRGARPGGFRSEPRRGPAAALHALDGDAGAALSLAALPNVGLASIGGARIVFPHATPEYFAEFAAQARGSARVDRRLLRHDAGADRRNPGGGRRDRAAGAASRRARAAAHPASASSQTKLQRMLRERRVRRLGAARPAARRERADGLIDAARRDQGVGRRALVDVNDNPRARARMNGVMASVAIQRGAGPRGDPPPDAARLER